MPQMRTAMVFCEQPFHSFRMMPQTLENTTFSAMRMQNDKVSIVPPASKNERPRLSPKNCEYHRAPASRQKSRLLPQTEVLA